MIHSMFVEDCHVVYHIAILPFFEVPVQHHRPPSHCFETFLAVRSKIIAIKWKIIRLNLTTNMILVFRISYAKGVTTRTVAVAVRPKLSQLFKFPLKWRNGFALIKLQLGGNIYLFAILKLICKHRICLNPRWESNYM